MIIFSTTNITPTPWLQAKKAADLAAEVLHEADAMTEMAVRFDSEWLTFYTNAGPGSSHTDLYTFHGGRQDWTHVPTWPKEVPAWVRTSR